jgi:hypothetical protein
MFEKRKAPKTIIHSANEDMVFDKDKGIGFVANQFVSDSWQVGMRDEKAESTRKREKNFMHIGSIPVIFVNKWKRQGFDIFDKNVTFKDIAARLRAENLDDFISTAKRF